MSKRFPIFVGIGFLVGAVAMGGCQSKTISTDAGDSGPDGCEEGRTASCPCPGEGAGSQVCRADGTWGPCRCASDATEVRDGGRDAGGTDATADADGSSPSDGGPAGDGRDVDSSSEADGDTDGGGVREPSPHLPEPPIETSLGAKERHVAALPESGVVDVTDAPYNAPNDGEEDAHDAIATAIDDHAGSGDTIYLPAGDYRITETIFVAASDAPITLKGDGSHTRILVDQQGYDAIGVGDYRSENRVEGVVVRDMFVHKTADAVDNENGVTLRNTFVDDNHGEVRNVWIDGFVGKRGGGLRVGMDGDSVVKHVTVSNSGSHGIGVPNYDPDDRVRIESALAFANGFYNELSYGIDGDGIVVEDAIAIQNAQGGKSSPDSPPSNGPTTTWRNVWFIENEGIGFQVTETVPNGLQLDGVYSVDNQGWGFRLTDKVEDQFTGDVRAVGNGRNGENGNVLVRSSRLDFDRIEVCDAVGGPGMWVSGGAGGSVGTVVHSGNAEGGLTGSPENLEIGSTLEEDCSVPTVPR